MKFLQSIKDNYLEFSLLPSPVKIAIGTTIGVLLLCLLVFGISSVASDRKINSLEKMNTQLTKAAVTAQDKAKAAELNAANENLRSQNLEAQIKELQAVKDAQDHEIQSQTKKSTDIRNSITHLRVSAPKPISTDDLERRLEDRYGKAKSNQ